MASFVINYYSTHISICIYMSIPQYSLSNAYNVTCIYVFRADHLVLDNQWVCSFLGRATPFIHIFPRWPVVLCVGLRPLSFFLCSLAGSLINVQLTFRLLCCVALFVCVFKQYLKERLKGNAWKPLIQLCCFPSQVEIPLFGFMIHRQYVDWL